MSDRDKARLRGPVKTVVQESTLPLPDGSRILTTTTRYTPDGRILEDRTRNPDGSEWVTTYTYSSDGRLLKTASGGASGKGSETTYLYDEANRLVGIRSGEKLEVTRRADSSRRGN